MELRPAERDRRGARLSRTSFIWFGFPTFLASQSEASTWMQRGLCEIGLADAGYLEPPVLQETPLTVQETPLTVQETPMTGAYGTFSTLQSLAFLILK